MASDTFPVEVGLMFEGERIRRNDMQLELGGPKADAKWEIVRVRPAGDVVDGEIRVLGPDLDALAPGMSHPVGVLVEISGEKLEEDIEGVLERRIHEFLNYVEGFVHLNQRHEIWMRLSRRSFEKGLNSFRYLGQVLIRLFRDDLPIIEAMQVTWISDPDTVREMLDEAVSRYETRDARARGLLDEDVDTFYGCALCQSFAPTHVCVITPQRYANCGAISWFDGRAAAGIDPKGPIFGIAKGACLNEKTGEYEGINEIARKRSMGEVERVSLYSAFEFPHTSCGCFEGIAFYIPEVDGIAVVHRGFRGPAVNGIPFSTMADSTAGGRQVSGFHGISIEYMRSSRFLQADGGYGRVVWMPGEVLERVREYIPDGLADRIATEKDALSVGELKAFLEKTGHPVTGRWKPDSGREQDKDRKQEKTVLRLSELPIRAGGITLVLKNARITAERVIIERRPDDPRRRT